MRKPLVAVDADDVLTYSAISLVGYGNERFGFEHTIDDFDEDITAMWQLASHADTDRHVNQYLTSGRLETLEPIPGAREELERLKKYYRFAVLTSRRDIAKDVTRAYIGDFFPGIFEAIHHTGIYGKGKEAAHTLTKGDMLVEIGAAYLVDDMLKHCASAPVVHKEAALFGNYPWNQTTEPLPVGVERCVDWAAVAAFLMARVQL